MKEINKKLFVIVVFVLVLIIGVLLVLLAMANNQSEKTLQVEEVVIQPEPVTDGETKVDKTEVGDKPENIVVEQESPVPGWSDYSASKKTGYFKNLSLSQRQNLWGNLSQPDTFWQSLTLEQKLAFNPNGCPVSSDGVIKISAENADCQEDSPSGPIGEVNEINLRLTQDGQDLTAAWDGSDNHQTGRRLHLTAFRINKPSDCHSNVKIPAKNSYSLLPYASQHWQTKYIFRVGKNDINKYVCLHGVETIDASQALTKTHTKAVMVRSFKNDSGWRIKRHLLDGRLTIYASTYLAVNKPAWEYVKPQIVPESGRQCNQNTFSQANPEDIVSQTYKSPQHLFDLFGTGFNYHNAGASKTFTINLTNEDINKYICIRVRNSFDEVKYKDYLIDKLSQPIMVT